MKIKKSDGPVDIHNSQIGWGRSQRGKAFHITSHCFLFLTTFYQYKQSSFQHNNNLHPMGTRTLPLSELFCPARLTDDTRRSLSQRDDNPPVRRTEAGPIRHLTPGNIHPDSPDRWKQWEKISGLFDALLPFSNLNLLDIYNLHEYIELGLCIISVKVFC